MADISVKMGVSGVAQYKQAMKDATTSAKTLDAALKLNEKQYQATGDKEKYMQKQTELLGKKLQAQKQEVKAAEQALKAMSDQGVDKASAAYQQMEQKLLTAQAALLDTQNAMQSVGQESQTAAQKADQLSESLSGINKKVSLDAVIQGIGKITGGLEAAGKKAIEVGKQIWNNILDSAQLADDTNTAAAVLGMNVEDYQKYKGVFDTIGDITVNDWMNAKRKIQKAINDPSSDQIDVLSALGISTKTWKEGGKFGPQAVAKDWETVFWEAAQTLQARVESGQISDDMADTWGEALFGKKFASLKPLIGLGQEAFTAALEEQNVASQEAIEKDAALNDAVIKLQSSFDALKMEVTSGIAPALTDAAGALDSLLGRVIEFLQSEQGQKALEDMGKAVENLFGELSEIDPEQVVDSVTNVFTGLVDGLKWIADHSSDVIGALKTIVAGWAGLKLTGGALTILQLINGLKGLGAGSAAAAGASAGAAWGTGFANAVAAAAPWLVGAYVLAKPSETASDDLDTIFNPETGQLTTAGWDDLKNNPQNWAKVFQEVGEIFGDLGRITADNNAINAIAKYWTGNGTLEGMISELEALGYLKKQLEENPKTNLPDEIKRVETTGETYIKDRRTGKLTPIVEKTLPDLESVLGSKGGEYLNANLAGLEIPIEPTAPENAAETITQEVGVVEIPAKLIPFGTNWISPSFTGGAGAGGKTLMQFHANGLPYVPFDGYPAILHRGERVMSAREVAASRNFNSNLYVESMYMSNGMDAEALAAAMAAANKRVMTGFGS